MITDSITFWDEKAKSPVWQEYILPGRTPAQFEREGYVQAKRFSKLVSPESTVIDYGCGPGRITRYLKLWYKEVIGIDISKEYINRAKKATKGIKGLSFITVDQCKAEENIADLIICIMVMQHNNKENREIIINDIHRLLKPGGKTLISFPMIESSIYKETDFVHKFTRWEVNEYGKKFGEHNITKDRLVNYRRPVRSGSCHEYFLKAMK